MCRLDKSRWKAVIVFKCFLIFKADIAFRSVDYVLCRAGKNSEICAG